MLAMPIERSADLAEAFARFEAEVDSWIRDALAAAAPCTDVHDQGTYTTGWVPYLLRRPCHPARAFMASLRDRIAAHFSGKGLWRHGYWVMHEAHHGTEHFELFLGALHALEPADPRTIAAIDDACEHLGHWSPDVPAWFDEARGIFRSMWFGADGIRTPQPGTARPAPNTPDHLRAVNLALLAHTATGHDRYARFARHYARRWAMAIADARRIPVGLDADGGVEDFDAAALALYRGIVGQAPALDGESDAVARAENFLASGVVGTFLRLGAGTGDDAFLRAAERLLDALATRASDPDAGAAIADLAAHERLIGSGRYRDVLRRAAPSRPRTLAIEPLVARSARPPGIGKRKDMPRWLEDGRARSTSPVHLAAAAELSGDPAMAVEALDLGRTMLALARRVYDHGQAHGCSARSVGAIARGHGRENGVGVVTGVYAPLARAFG